MNRYGAPLGASGVRFKLAQYVEGGRTSFRRFPGKGVASTFGTRPRSTWSPREPTHGDSHLLGHAHLDTTNHYARASLETKREALERLTPSKIEAASLEARCQRPRLARLALRATKNA